MNGGVNISNDGRCAGFDRRVLAWAGTAISSRRRVDGDASTPTSALLRLRTFSTSPPIVTIEPSHRATLNAHAIRGPPSWGASRRNLTLEKAALLPAMSPKVQSD